MRRPWRHDLAAAPDLERPEQPGFEIGLHVGRAVTRAARAGRSAAQARRTVQLLQDGPFRGRSGDQIANQSLMGRDRLCQRGRGFTVCHKTLSGLGVGSALRGELTPCGKAFPPPKPLPVPPHGGLRRSATPACARKSPPQGSKQHKCSPLPMN